MIGGDGNDSFSDSERNNYLDGGAGSDTYYWGSYEHNDTIADGPNGEDWIQIEGSEGNITALTQDGNDMVLQLGESSLRLEGWFTSASPLRNIQFTHSENAYELQADGFVIRGNDLANSLYGASFNDTLYGYAGNDVLDGGSGANYLDGGDGSDTLYGRAGDDSLVGGAGNDALEGDEGNDVLYGETGNDTLHGWYGNDILYGGDGNDSLAGSHDNDTVYGDAGNDTVCGNEGGDLLDGGVGNDVLIGGSGVDQYHFAGMFGRDLIAADDTNAEDRVFFDGFTHAQLAPALSGNDLILTLDEGNTVTIQDWGLDSDTALNQFAFSDGNFKLNGDVNWDSVDYVEGTLITGTPGNDLLNGGVGNDTYYYGFGAPTSWSLGLFGNDTIAAGAGNGNDVIVVDNIDAIAPVKSGNDLILSVWGSSGAGAVGVVGTITLQDWLVADSDQRIHNLTLRDGYRYFGVGNNPIEYSFDVDITGNGTLRDYSGNSLNQMYFGLEGNDTILGGAGKDWLYGSDGNDQVSGGNGDDQVYGNAGDDWLSGGAGNDYVRGGTGSDTMAGGAGNDVYRFGSGANVVVYDADVNGNDLILADADSSRDVLYFRNTNMSNYAELVGDDLVLYYWNEAEDRNYSVTLQGWGLGGGNRINQYQQNYSMGENIRYNLSGGTNGGDSVNYSGNTNALLYYGFDGDDSFHGGEARDRVYGGNGADEIYGGNGDDRLKGQGGNDLLYGEAGNDVLFGGIGNDWFSGGSGSDTYWFGNSDPTVAQDDLGNDTIAGSAENYQDVLQLHNVGLLQGAVKSGNDLQLEFLNLDQGGAINSITLESWFAGQEYQIRTLTNQQGNSTTTYMLQAGLVSDDYTEFNSSNAVMYFGLEGNDTVYGGSGGDILVGGTGADELYGGGGNDILFADTSSAAAYASIVASVPGY